jgi:hypothetical protein
MMHELSQGAGYIRWFEDYPYGYYHADTTPLYLIAVRDYVRASGDLALAREFWPSMRKAYDYCASTDEDGDGLMDNTKAGLAAVETGTLRRRDVLTDVFLGAAWTEAAAAAADLAAVADPAFEPTARAAAAKARASLNLRFLDDQNRRIHFAVMKDGKGQSEQTVWPAFGIWRGVFDTDRPAVAGMLDELAGSGLGTDWGARMLSRESKLYEPLSYNNGAVWPFLTGFASLALYTGHRAPAAWAYLDGTADLTFLEARGYMAELFSGDRLRSVDAAVPHQLFATTGFVSTLMRGLVGLGAGEPAPDADRARMKSPVRLAPQLPPGWRYLRVKNLQWQDSRFDVALERADSSYSVRITPRAGARVPLQLELTLPPGAELLPSKRRATGFKTNAGRGFPGLSAVKGSPAEAGLKARSTGLETSGTFVVAGGDQTRGIRVALSGDFATEELLQVRYRPGIEIAPINEPLQSGDEPRRLRIIDARLEGQTYTVQIQGLSGQRYRVRLDVPFAVASISGGREVGQEGFARIIEVAIPEGPSPWTSHALTVTIGKRLAGRQ